MNRKTKTLVWLAHVKQRTDETDNSMNSTVQLTDETSYTLNISNEETSVWFVLFSSLAL